MRMAVSLLFGLLLCTQVRADDRGNVVVAELRDGQVMYEVEGKKSDLDGAIAMLRERRNETRISPREDVAIIVASNELSIRQVQQLYSALQAYGFNEVHVFAFDSDRARLQEFGFAMQVIPFTTDRVQLMNAITR